MQVATARENTFSSSTHTHGTRNWDVYIKPEPRRCRRTGSVGACPLLRGHKTPWLLWKPSWQLLWSGCQVSPQEERRHTCIQRQVYGRSYCFTCNHPNGEQPTCPSTWTDTPRTPSGTWLSSKQNAGSCWPADTEDSTLQKKSCWGKRARRKKANLWFHFQKTLESATNLQ